MAIKFFDGFEINHDINSNDYTTNMNYVITSENPHGGDYCLKGIFDHSVGGIWREMESDGTHWVFGFAVRFDGDMVPMFNHGFCQLMEKDTTQSYLLGIDDNYRICLFLVENENKTLISRNDDTVINPYDQNYFQVKWNKFETEYISVLLGNRKLFTTYLGSVLTNNDIIFGLGLFAQSNDSSLSIYIDDLYFVNSIGLQSTYLGICKVNRFFIRSVYEAMDVSAVNAPSIESSLDDIIPDTSDYVECESAESYVNLIFDNTALDVKNIAAIKIQTNTVSDDTNALFKVYHSLYDISSGSYEYLKGHDQFPYDQINTNIIEYNPFTRTRWKLSDLSNVAFGFKLIDVMTDVTYIEGYCEHSMYNIYYDTSCCYLVDGTYIGVNDQNYLVIKIVDAGEVDG